MEGDNMCLSSPCWNGGICKGNSADWTCLCPSGYTGRNCRTIEATPCINSNPCKNGASCQNINTNGITKAKKTRLNTNVKTSY